MCASISGLIPQLEQILQRPDIQSSLHHYVERKQHIPPGVLADIYDGRVWKEWEATKKFKNQETTWFTDKSWDLALQLNADGFQPFEGSNYSVTAVYFTLLNLPLEIRHNIENVIVVALLPGLKRSLLRYIFADSHSLYLLWYIMIVSGPKGIAMEDMHRVLRPIVTELEQLYEGVNMTLPPSAGYSTRVVRFIQAVLILVSADAPELRRFLGFAGHTGKNMCTKCECRQDQIHLGFSKIPADQVKFASIPARTKEKHRRDGNEWRGCYNDSQRKACVHASGYLYTPLNDLVYFDAIRFAVIDPMHALLLGLAKHLMQTLTDVGVLKPSVFTAMQEKMDRVRTPSELGRIPRKIDSKFSKLKADQVVIGCDCCWHHTKQLFLMHLWSSLSGEIYFKFFFHLCYTLR